MKGNYLIHSLNVMIVILFTQFIFSPPISGETNRLDLTKSVIVCPKDLKGLESKAVAVLVEEVEKRTAIRWQIQHQLPVENIPIIAVGTERELQKLIESFLNPMGQQKKPGAEGYRLSVQTSPRPVVILAGNDPRGVLYAVGGLLRQLHWEPNRVEIDADLQISTTPRYPIRGHQLGYRPKTNAYDAWSVAQFDQYIRELAIFGANSIEIIPPRTDDDRTSPLMKLPPMKMLIEQARIIDAYGMDVWLWYPNMGKNYDHPDSIKRELKERDEIFKRLKRIDVVFVPGGDPGDLHPDVLFDWLGKVAGVLNKYHPQAKIWVSPQAFQPVKLWLDSFYSHVNQKYAWFGGVVFGPWVKTPLPEIRQIVSSEIPIRRYPDITHSLSCQYPIYKWDLAYAMTLGRECINPRPVAEKQIHNLFAHYANGSISYSEGTNDDVNKFIWSAQDWDPTTPVIVTLREYGRLFIGETFAEGVAQGLLALEKNVEGPLLTNTGVDVTLKQWQAMERQASSAVMKNYRFQMGLLRAYYDAYIHRRLIHETELENRALDILRQASKVGSISSIDQAEQILMYAQTEPVAQDYYQRCNDLADSLFKSIGAQLTVEKHGAISRGRGAFIDAINEPLNDARWLLYQLTTIRKLSEEQQRLDAINQITERTNPGPGGFYDNLGSPGSWRRVASDMSWAEDPGSLQSPRVSFGVGLIGEEWIHTVEAKGFEGVATHLAWMNQITTLYDTTLRMRYEDLDPNSVYFLKVSYTGRFRSKIKLIVDDQFLIHDFIQTGTHPIYEFDIPPAAFDDGILELSWTCGEGERGAQVAEIWLIRKQ